jgi:hypothetical protein
MRAEAAQEDCQQTCGGLARLVHLMRYRFITT